MRRSISGAAGLSPFVSTTTAMWSSGNITFAPMKPGSSAAVAPAAMAVGIRSEFQPQSVARAGAGLQQGFGGHFLERCRFQNRAVHQRDIP